MVAHGVVGESDSGLKGHLSFGAHARRRRVLFASSLIPATIYAGNIPKRHVTRTFCSVECMFPDIPLNHEFGGIV